MNIFKFTSGYQRNLDSRIHAVARRRKLAFIGSLVAISCLAFSPAWAGYDTYAKMPATPIHLTGLSIQIGPGGFHLGIGVPSNGRAHVRTHGHLRPAPRTYWNPSRYNGNRHHYASPKRFNQRHGWKRNGPRGNFAGNGGRGTRGHGGGHR